MKKRPGSAHFKNTKILSKSMFYEFMLLTCGISDICMSSPVASSTRSLSFVTIQSGSRKNETFPALLPSDSTILPLMTAFVFGFSNFPEASNFRPSDVSTKRRFGANLMFLSF